MAKHQPTNMSRGQNTLVLAASVSDEKRSACRSRLRTHTEGGSPNYLNVTYTQPPAAVVEEWREDIGPLPNHTYVVRVRERIGSADADALEGEERVSVATANPNDLTGLAMRLRDVIDQANRDDRPLVICFDSLTSLLQYTDMEAAYRFLHMFTGQIRDAGAVAHFHLDPQAFDDRTVSRVRSVFDEVVTPDE